MGQDCDEQENATLVIKDDTILSWIADKNTTLLKKHNQNQNSLLVKHQNDNHSPAQKVPQKEKSTNVDSMLEELH